VSAPSALRPDRPGRLGRATGESRLRALLPVTGLTLAALALRLAGAGQSLFGDELFLYDIVHRDDVGEVLQRVHDTESTPPLHFLLAWASAQVGDPTLWVRGPSLVLGTATVPLVYALGRRTVGVRAALVGAAIAAFSPFAVFYSIEARAYATLGFLSALSTLLLLIALERRRAWPWVAFGAACVAVLYTHYAGVFVVAAQGLWALSAHRAQWRRLGLVYAAVALAYAPWIPSYLVQRVDSAAVRIEALYPLDLESALHALIELFAGWPLVPLRELPGQPAVAVLCAGLLVAALAAIAQRARTHRTARPRDAGFSSPVALLIVLALATPVGALLYSLGPTSIYAPRNLIPSMPALFLLAGALVTRPVTPWRGILTLLVLGPVLFGAVQALDSEVRRAPFRSAAELIDDQARPGDVVAYRPLLAVDRPSPLRTDLTVHLRQPHRVVPVDRRPRLAWRLARPGGRVFSVALVRRGFPGPSRPPADLAGRFRPVESHLYPGAQRIGVVVYERSSAR
jgi:4-amino-4-deoxy-L-arabinose transferase-like glycosyltransferase